MPFQVRGVNGETYTVNDANSDQKIDINEVVPDDAAKTESLDLLQGVLDGVLLSDLSGLSGTVELKTLLEAAGKSYPAALKGKDAAAVKKQVEKWKKEFETLAQNKTTASTALETKREALETARGTVSPNPANITAAQEAFDRAQAAVNAINRLLKVVTEQLKAVPDSGVPEDVKADVKQFLLDKKVLSPKDGGDGLGKGKAGTASVTINSGLPMYATGAGGASGAPGGGLFGVTPQPTGYPPFDPAAFYQSGLLQQYNAEGMDAIMAQQSKAQKMMMLFFYFAQQAMTGDIGAMYQFVRFITALITKDKAHQNVAMAEKLIQLQDASRKATDIMLKEDAYDPENPEVAANFSKVMERSKADQGEIAVSQKLIAQMLEEFSQVSEAMTGLQKSLLDARGRIMGMESVWRG